MATNTTGTLDQVREVLHPLVHDQRTDAAQRAAELLRGVGIDLDDLAQLLLDALRRQQPQPQPRVPLAPAPVEDPEPPTTQPGQNRDWDDLVASLRHTDGASIVIAITGRHTYDEGPHWTVHANGYGLCPRGGHQLIRYPNPYAAAQAVVEALEWLVWQRQIWT